MASDLCRGGIHKNRLKLPGSMSGTTDLSLIERLRRSPDDELWKRFLTIYTPYVDRCLSSIDVQEADVADIRQEVMRVLVAELPKFEHNRRTGAFRNWLRQIVANRLRTFQRSIAKQAIGVGGDQYRSIADQLVDCGSELSRRWDEEHNRYLVDCLIASVRPRFQKTTMQAFSGVVLEEAPAEAVAEELGISVNAVRIAQARVMRALRQLGEGLLS